MSAKVTVETLTSEHVNAIKDKLREADVKEVWDASHLKGEDALKASAKKSFLAWTALIDGEPIFCFGVAPLSQFHFKGQPWMLGTDEVDKLKLRILRQSKGYVGQMIYHFDELENWVHESNKVSINWLRWCGFKMDEPKEFGVEKSLFRRFWMKKGG